MRGRLPAGPCSVRCAAADSSSTIANTTTGPRRSSDARGNLDGDDIVEHHLPAAGRLAVVRAETAQFLRLQRPRAASSSTRSPRRSEERFQICAGDVDALALERLLLGSRVPRARQEPGRVRRRDATSCSASTRSPTESLGALNRMGQALFYPPNVKGWDGGCGLAQQSDDARAREFRQVTCVTSQMMQQRARGSSTVRRRRRATRHCGSITTILQGDASPRRSTAARALSRRNRDLGLGAALRRELEERDARRRLSHDGDARLPAELRISIMKRSRFLTRRGLGTDDRGATPTRFSPRRSPQPPLPGLSGRRRRSRSRRRQPAGRQRRPQHGRPIRDAAVLPVPSDARRRAERRAAHQRSDRLQSGS